MADPYRSQVGPGNSPVYGGASPEAFGAGVARGVQDVGGALSRAGARERERQRDEDAAAAGLELAQVSSELERASIDARNNAPEGGAGHTTTIETAADDRISKALGKIRDPHVKKAFEARYAELRGNVTDREYSWEAGQRIAKLGTDFDKMGTTFANGASTSRDALGLRVSLETIETAGRALNVSADVQDKLIQEQQRKVAAAYANATVDADPELLVGKGDQKGLLDDPKFNRYLEPEDLDKLRNGAHVEIRRRDAAAKQQKNLQDAQTREEIQTFRVGLTAGVEPSEAEFTTIIKKAEALGDTSTVAQLKVDQTRIGLNKETKPWTPAQYDSAIADLRAKGDKRTAGEDIRLKQLEAIAPGRKQEFKNDPYSWSANTGHPAPAIDWANPNPADVQKRVAWARSLQRETGLTYTPYLNNSEKEQLAAQLQTGPVGQVAVAAQLRGLFGVNGGTDVARQLDAGNRDLQLLVGIPEQTAQQYKRGAEALRQNGKLFDDEQAAAIFNEYRSAIPGDLQGSVFNLARSIAAATAVDQGQTDLKDSRDFPTIFRAAINRAGGALGGGGSSSGGFPEWRGRRLWLPQDVTAEDAQRRLTRAQPQAWINAGNGEPYWRLPSGKLVKLPPEQIRRLSQSQLETVNPGVFVPRLGGKVLVTKDGQTWRFDIRKLK